MRIAFGARSPYGGALDAEIAAATKATATLCADLGHAVGEADVDLKMMEPSASRRRAVACSA